MKLITVIHQRYADWRHEARIREALNRLTVAIDAGHRRETDEAWQEFADLINTRSTAQLLRMRRTAYQRTDPHAQAFFDGGGRRGL